MVRRARHGDFEPDQEVHSIRTPSMIKQLRRIQPLRRKLEKGQRNPSLILGWRKILHFLFQGLSFAQWIQFTPWVPLDPPLTGLAV